jgi:hypothetical protein
MDGRTRAENEARDFRRCLRCAGTDASAGDEMTNDQALMSN